MSSTARSSRESAEPRGGPATESPSVVIVSPARAEANNGNWRTAERWARHLSTHCRTRIVDEWRDGERADVLIALHARRSAPSLLRHAHCHPAAPRVLVLTGTDVYRDIHTDAEAQRALRAATRLVALQEDAVRQLPAALRSRCVVIHQSVEPACPDDLAPRSGVATGRALRVIEVAHLRDEKDPLTYLRAVERLTGEQDLAFELVGSPLQPELGEAARAVQARSPHFEWAGALPHHETRRRIAAADVLVNTSRMEGGAHVLIEAMVCGAAILATRIGGNLGMLGPEHPGLFEVGDDAGLAALILRCRDEPAFVERLREHGRRRAPVFAPEREREALVQLVQSLAPFRPVGRLA